MVNFIYLFCAFTKDFIYFNSSWRNSSYVVIPSALLLAPWTFHGQISNFLFRLLHSIWGLFLFFSHHNGLTEKEKCKEFKSANQNVFACQLNMKLERRIKTIGRKTSNVWNLILTKKRKRKIIDKWKLTFGRPDKYNFTHFYSICKMLAYFAVIV